MIVPLVCNIDSNFHHSYWSATMRLTQTSMLLAAIATLTIAAGESRSQPVVEQWIPLGCKQVGFAVDRDVLPVGKRDGRFRAIRLRAEGNNVFMMDLKVVYGSGNADDLPVRAEIRAGGTSGKLDLRGTDRAIDRVEMIYRSQPNFRGQANICVEGLAVVAAVTPPPPVAVVTPPPPTGGPWVRLGCQSVGFNVDRDVVRVGRRDGRFRAIRLVVGGNEVFIFDLKVVYGNGVPDDLPVKAAIRAGGTSGKLDLKGAARNIDRVEIIYRARPDFRGRAEVCVDGEPG
jgi:hypothetical protein